MISCLVVCLSGRLAVVFLLLRHEQRMTTLFIVLICECKVNIILSKIKTFVFVFCLFAYILPFILSITCSFRRYVCLRSRYNLSLNLHILMYSIVPNGMAIAAAAFIHLWLNGLVCAFSDIIGYWFRYDIMYLSRVLLRSSITLSICVVTFSISWSASYVKNTFIGLGSLVSRCSCEYCASCVFISLSCCASIA